MVVAITLPCAFVARSDDGRLVIASEVEVAFVRIVAPVNVFVPLKVFASLKSVEDAEVKVEVEKV